MNALDFCQNLKTLFLELFGPYSHVGTFFQKLRFVTFLTLRLSNFNQKISENWWANEIFRSELTPFR